MAGLPVAPKVMAQYVSDNGITYKMLVANYLTTQNDTGGASIIGYVAATGSEPRWPAKYKPRRALMRDTVNNKDREVTVLKPDAPLIAVPTPAGAGTLNLNRGVNASYAYTYQGSFKTEVGPSRRY